MGALEQEAWEGLTMTVNLRVDGPLIQSEQLVIYRDESSARIAVAEATAEFARPDAVTLTTTPRPRRRWPAGNPSSTARSPNH